MSECKHGLKQGCAYCHAPTAEPLRALGKKKRARSSSLAEKMNDRMTALSKRLRELRGE
jgi:hypothetical protein